LIPVPLACCAVLKARGEAWSRPVSGGYGEGETPLPIPNRAVKPLSADGTWPARAWESRTPPVFSFEPLTHCVGGSSSFWAVAACARWAPAERGDGGSSVSCALRPTLGGAGGRSTGDRREADGRGLRGRRPACNRRRRVSRVRMGHCGLVELVRWRQQGVGDLEECREGSGSSGGEHVFVRYSGRRMERAAAATAAPVPTESAVVAGNRAGRGCNGSCSGPSV
jgi:hypothetical protein